MGTSSDIITSAGPDQARDTAYQVLASLGFTVTPTGQYSANAQRGSKGMTLALGAFSGTKNQHLNATISVFTHPAGAAVRFVRSNTGMVGGLIGMNRVNNLTNDVVNALIRALPPAR